MRCTKWLRASVVVLATMTSVVAMGSTGASKAFALKKCPPGQHLDPDTLECVGSGGGGGGGVPTPMLDQPYPGSAAMQHVIIHNLFMDTNWDAHNPPEISRHAIDDYTRKLISAGYFSNASQYGVASVSVAGWGDEATSNCPPPPPNFGYSGLSNWILCEKHSLPALDENINLWQVYVPVNSGFSMQITWPWGHTWQLSTSCTDFSGFHTLSTPSVLPPDPPQVFGAVFTSCLARWDLLRQTTEVSSHELIEAVTDPAPGLGWYNHGLGLTGEAGDLCENGPGGAFDNGRYAMAGYWSNADRACVTPGNGAIFINVPAVGGQPLAQATNTLAAAGLRVTVQSRPDRTCNQIGNVVGQTPNAGTPVQPGANVNVYVAVKPPTPCP